MSDPRYLQEGYKAQSAHVVEEIGEVMGVLGDLAAAIGKAGRWGLESFNPDLEPEDQETNRAWIMRAMAAAKPELKDVVEAIDRLHATMSESEWMRRLLELIAAEPFYGTIDSSDTGRPHPLDPWVDDLGRETDTFNLAHEAGYLATGHDSDTDSSTTRLTSAGRAVLSLGLEK